MVSMQGRSIFIRLLRCKLHMISWQPDDCQPLSETRCDSNHLLDSPSSRGLRHERGVYSLPAWIGGQRWQSSWKKRDYRLSFNLSTELGKDICERNNRSSESLREKTDKYNLWTRNVTKVIRKTGGNNAQRILILGSPKKLPRTYLKSIQKSMKMITIRWLSGIFMHLV